ncbi:MAG: RluA family pseudouridine synthase [Clostridia bacterium]|nr:RluA family pseudouridine synthase [Clostridia bacterium]
MINNKFIVSEQVDRADIYLSEKTGFTRSHIKILCDEGNLFVNGKIAKSNKKLKVGDEVVFTVPENKPLDLEPKNIPLDIVYEDEDLAVINKPQGMTVHAGNGTKGDTLVNALLYHLDNLSGINGVIRPGIVHRIDKNTSGLLVVAKNDKTHVALAKQLENKTCHREYVALLEGVLKNDSGRIETFIGRDKNNRTKMAVSSFGRRAITDYKVLERFNNFTLCEFSLKTGRTHQIRVHAKYLGHPVVGDIEYGYKNQKFKLNGQLLHARKLEFVHPSTGKVVSFEAPIPDYFMEIIKKVRGK